MSDKVWDVILASVIILAIVGAFSVITREPPTATVRDLYEGSAEWVAVDAIENENILLKKKLDDLRVHYDSLVCYRPR
jgi:hypothetical protein